MLVGFVAYPLAVTFATLCNSSSAIGKKVQRLVDGTQGHKTRTKDDLNIVKLLTERAKVNSDEKINY